MGPDSNKMLKPGFIKPRSIYAGLAFHGNRIQIKIKGERIERPWPRAANHAN